MKHCILVNKALKLLLCQINLEKPTETFKMVTVHLTVHSIVSLAKLLWELQHCPVQAVFLFYL